MNEVEEKRKDESILPVVRVSLKATVYILHVSVACALDQVCMYVHLIAE